jgi:hypothetical protein
MACIRTTNSSRRDSSPEDRTNRAAPAARSTLAALGHARQVDLPVGCDDRTANAHACGALEQVGGRQARAHVEIVDARQRLGAGGAYPEHEALVALDVVQRKVDVRVFSRLKLREWPGDGAASRQGKVCLASGVVEDHLKGVHLEGALRAELDLT